MKIVWLLLVLHTNPMTGEPLTDFIESFSSLGDCTKGSMAWAINRPEVDVSSLECKKFTEEPEKT